MVQLSNHTKYIELLGEEQTAEIAKLFQEIENGKYNKEERHTFNLTILKHPVHIRAIRADMQSFVNTFIDPYLTQKPYMQNSGFVIDAGANIGYTAVLFANWWPGAKIISIEPDSENYELAALNFKPYRNIELLHGGLWPRTADLQIEAGQEDGFVVREVKDISKVDQKNLSKGISIDEILIRYKGTQIDFLKMNIEGSEKEIFTENYKSWIPKTKAMLIELHDGKNQGCSTAVFSALSNYDFAVAETAPYGILFVKEKNYREWYAKWYKEEIYKPNIDKNRFPEFYLDKEH